MLASSCFSAPGKDRGGAAGAGSVVETLNSMGRIGTAEVLRLRATSALARDKSVGRSAQDDDSVAVLTKNILDKLALLGRSGFVEGTEWIPRQSSVLGRGRLPGLFVAPRPGHQLTDRVLGRLAMLENGGHLLGDGHLHTVGGGQSERG
jgi:hypothetical protein